MTWEIVPIYGSMTADLDYTRLTFNMFNHIDTISELGAYKKRMQLIFTFCVTASCLVASMIHAHQYSANYHLV